MRQIALVLGLATFALATQTLSQPRKISGINVRTIASDGPYAYVDNGGTIYRLQRTDDGIRKMDSIGYEGNHTEGALYIPRTETQGFLVFKDSVCSVNWQWYASDRMMCAGGVSLGWGDYSGGITMGKLNVCGGAGAYTFDIQSMKPVLKDSLAGPDRKVCEVVNPDVIEVRRGTDVMNFYSCHTVAECGDVPDVSIPTSRTFERNRIESNGANMVMLDSMGRLGLWSSPPTPNVQPIQGYQPGLRSSAYLAASHQAGDALVAVGFDSTLVFGRRVDLGLETNSRVKFDDVVRTMDLDKNVLWLQVGRDIVSFDIQESASSIEPAMDAKSAWLHRDGRILDIQAGESGASIRIHRPDGSLEAGFPAGSGAVRWVAPGPGLRIVRVGSVARAVLVP